MLEEIKCKEQYIDDNFALYNGDSSDYIAFFYEKGSANMVISFENYKGNDDIPPIGIPTDTYEIYESEVNGHTAYLLEEDNQFRMFFLDERILCVIFAENLDYPNCHKIVNSYS